MKGIRSADLRAWPDKTSDVTSLIPWKHGSEPPNMEFVRWQGLSHEPSEDLMVPARNAPEVVSIIVQVDSQVLLFSELFVRQPDWVQTLQISLRMIRDL